MILVMVSVIDDQCSSLVHRLVEDRETAIRWVETILRDARHPVRFYLPRRGINKVVAQAVEVLIQSDNWGAPARGGRFSDFPSIVVNLVDGEGYAEGQDPYEYSCNARGASEIGGVQT